MSSMPRCVLKIQEDHITTDSASSCAPWLTEYEIPYKVDIYPYYGSDGEAFWRAGGDVAVALIGPGVDASHNYERTHLDALIATTKWIMAYLLN